MRTVHTVGLVLAMVLAGCTTADPAVAPPAPAAQVPMPGSDRDAHGCIGSAGYRWCAATARCERPWELARANGFDNTAEAYAAFCAVEQAPVAL